jgi:hypothetical protein
MRKTLRLCLLAACALAALGFTSIASAAYSPTLLVSGNNVTFSQTNADDPTAHVTILAPLGYATATGQAAGTQIGTLEGSVIAGAFGGATVPVAGTITTGDPTSQTLQAAAKACTGVEIHKAIWLLNVTAAGQSLPAPVPMYVDAPPSAPFNAFSSASIQLCLPHPSLAAFQIKLLSATLHLTGIFTPPLFGGTFRWTGINTPWDPNNPTVNVLGTIETQSVERAPVSTYLDGVRTKTTKKVKKKKVNTYFAKLSGAVYAGPDAVGGANVDIMVGDTKVATVTTDNDGNYSTKLKLTKTTTYTAHATTTSGPLLGATCVPPLPFGPGTMPCGTIESAGIDSTSGELTLKKPKK